MSAVFEKMDFLCRHESILKDFSEFSFELNKNPWCTDGEEHSFEWCSGDCYEIKFLIPIMEEMRKDISVEEKKRFLS